MEEQAKKMEEQTEQLAGEVASLREALEKLVTQMAAKWTYSDRAIVFFSSYSSQNTALTLTVVFRMLNWTCTSCFAATV